MIALPRFSRQELLFSLKSFFAAMLAIYLSSRFGLPRPFWAMMTAYIVAHPLASNVRSKALYRFLGTLLGCAATVVLVPSLSGSPELLSLTLALWVGLCLYFSLLDRSARSYIFMLAGYSAALIGFPLVDAPASMFDTAVARVTEIGLGILCASLVHSLVLPAGLAPSLLGVMDRVLGDARQWLTDLLREPPNEAKAMRMAADRGGFNRSMQHTHNCLGRRSVAHEVPDTDLLHKYPEGIDVGAVEGRLDPSPDRPAV